MKSTAMECKRQIFIPMCTLVCTKRRSPQRNSSGNTLLEQLVHRMLTVVGGSRLIVQRPLLSWPGVFGVFIVDLLPVLNKMRASRALGADFQNLATIRSQSKQTKHRRSAERRKQRKPKLLGAALKTVGPLN
ncbi:hypothetical protein THAOC_32798 [Thalassiosira oceanica]|uniref:Uncharacterized protein n=1 Tax=Thalassiosira oceanica TaxID=159749 RepID=K0R570_THAOC|nr:hypothetical protein THAOC_32798 [Thalassiosira oceanica]|eukprot:EJK48403.1 hypothetical protein THAOC_32798 [Thalassiosira oceanica]